MNSRDKLRDVELKKKLQDNLEDLFKTDPTLIKLQKERRQKALQDQLGDSKPISDILSKLIKSNPSLKNLLGGGTSIFNPYDSSTSDNDKDSDSFIGLPFPTYFNLVTRMIISLYQKNGEHELNSERMLRVIILAEIRHQAL